jgi:hypothetical protein
MSVDLRGSGDDPRVWGGIAERVFGHLRERGRLLNRISGSLMIGAAGLLVLKYPSAHR